MLTSVPVFWLTLCRSQQHTPVDGPPCVVAFNLPQRDVVEYKCEVIFHGTYLEITAAWMRSSRGWLTGRFRVPSETSSCEQLRHSAQHCPHMDGRCKCSHFYTINQRHNITKSLVVYFFFFYCDVILSICNNVNITSWLFHHWLFL